MDNNRHHLDDLNAEQIHAVTHGQGPLLVVAGPGSGKTRVIANRIAHLVSVENVPSRRILAVTFTNKAAGEMKERVKNQLGTAGQGADIFTFHGWCTRQLRRHGAEVKLRNDFMIRDRDDQETFVKQAMLLLDHDPKEIKPGNVLDVISHAKSQLLSPQGFLEKTLASPAENVMDRVAAAVYPEYQRMLASSNSVDFDDLIRLTVALLETSESVRRQLQGRYLHMLVDEFQDTDPLQYKLCQLVAARHRNLCVVGDPDQSIYGWRDAQIDNILGFAGDYPGTTEVKLGRNYRSTPQILDVARSLIINNKDRIDNPLTTQMPHGPAPTFEVLDDTYDEARVSVQRLGDAVDGDPERWSDCAVLFRTNRQSRVLEEACIRGQIPYRLMGGQPFYHRAEIKDVLAYLHLVVNPDDIVSFMRVINRPSRRIGAKTVDKITTIAGQHGISPMETVMAGGYLPKFSRSTTDGIARFVMAMESLRDTFRTSSVHELTLAVLDETGLGDHIKNRDNGSDRWDNVLESWTWSANSDRRMKRTGCRHCWSRWRYMTRPQTRTMTLRA